MRTEHVLRNVTVVEKRVTSTTHKYPLANIQMERKIVLKIGVLAGKLVRGAFWGLSFGCQNCHNVFLRVSLEWVRKREKQMV